MRSYAVTGADTVTTDVELAVHAGSDLTPTDGSPPAEMGYRQQDLTIAGRPAREWRNDTGRQDSMYTVALRLPEDRVVQVKVYVPLSIEGRGATLATIGRRVAASLRLDRPEPIDTAFRPTYLPSGFVVQEVGRSDQVGTSWILAAPGAVPGAPAVFLSQDSHALDRGSIEATVADGRPVQGRPTYVLTSDAGITLRVEGFRPGVSVEITATQTAVPLDELYKIAEGIRWTG